MTTAYFLSVIIFAISIQLSSCTQCGSLTIKCNSGDLSCYSGLCALMASHLINLNRLPFGTYSPTPKPTNFPTAMTPAPTPNPTFPIVTHKFNTITPINYQQQSEQTITYNEPHPINIITRHSTSTIITKSPTSYPTIKPTLNPINKPTTNPTKKPSTNPTNKPIYIWTVSNMNLGGGSSSSSSEDQAMFKQKQSENLVYKNEQFDVENKENNLNGGNQTERKNILVESKILLWLILMPFIAIILFGVCYKCILMKKNRQINEEVGNEDSECILYSGYEQDDCIAENTSDIDSDDIPVPSHVVI